ncbi:MAG: TonB-dependent receptor [Steroidobacteraceae bacterium]
MRVSFAMVVACLVATGLSAAEQARAAVRKATNIEAQGLAPALRLFAKERDVSIVYRSELIGDRKTGGAAGELTLEEALSQLLSGTGLTYQLLDAEGLTIVPAFGTQVSPSGVASRSHKGRFMMAQATVPSPAAGSISAAPAEQSPQDTGPVEEILVTARKKEETLLSVPQTVNVLSSETISDYNLQSFEDYAAMVPNLAFSFGAGGGGYSFSLADSRAIILRGMAGSNTTNVYLDDVQIEQTQDPRIIDVERIEVLKGPQGTLFGGGSIGGTVRILTKQPNLHENEFGVESEAGFTKGGSGPDFGASAKGSVVVVPDKLAVRSMAFVHRDSGFVTRTYPLYKDDADSERRSVDGQGELVEYGASTTALLQLADNFSVTARLIGQWSELNGAPAVWRGRTQFDPDSLTYDRAFNLQDKQETHWFLPSLRLAYQGAGYEAVSSTSYFRRRSEVSWDVSEAVSQAMSRIYGVLDYSEPVQDFYNTDAGVFQQELRVSTDPWHNLSATFGAFYSSSKSKFWRAPRVVPGLQALSGISDNYYWLVEAPLDVKESAVFGELYYNIADVVKLTAGVRRFDLDLWTDIVQSGAILGSAGATPYHAAGMPARTGETGFSPKFSISVEPTDAFTIYGTAAKGFRVGGPGRTLISSCAPYLAEMGLTIADVEKGYRSDSVWSYESGVKMASLGKRLMTTVAVFQTDWKDIQQQVRLAGCGSSFTGNAGAARIRGAEMELNGAPTRGLGIRAGIGYTDAVITDNNNGRTAQAVGSRVYNTPRVTASAGFHYTRPIGDGREAFVSGDLSHVGDSLSANSSSTNPQIRGAYTISNIRVGTRWGKSEVSLFVNNITDEEANYGDLSPAANYTTVINGQTVENARIVVSRPLQMGVQFKRDF